MIRDLRRIILDYTYQMKRLERFRDYVYGVRHRRMVREFKFMHQYCTHVIAHFPHISVNKRVLCLEGFFLPLFVYGHTPSRIRLIQI